MELLPGKHTLGKEKQFFSLLSSYRSEVQSEGGGDSAGPIRAPQGPSVHPGLFMLRVGAEFSVPPTACMNLGAALCTAGVRAT